MNSACCNIPETSNRQTGSPGQRWRDGLLALGRAPLRLHRFRNLHTRLLYEALCERDCLSDATTAGTKRAVR